MIARTIILFLICGAAMTGDISPHDGATPDTASAEIHDVGPVLDEYVRARVLDNYEIVDLRPVMYHAGPLTPDIGEPAKWIIEHVDTLNGWSLTGWSKSGMFDCGNFYRVKAGIINGDLEASRISYILENEHLIEYQEWEKQLEQDPVFGVSLTVLF